MSSSSTDMEDGIGGVVEDRVPLVNRSEPPPDRFRLVLWIMFILGFGALLPWNMFITATPYFDDKFKKRTVGNKTISPGLFHCTYENYFAVASMVPNLIAVILNVRYAHWFSIKWRIGGSTFIVLLVFIWTTALVYPSDAHWQNSFFAITIVSVVIMNVASSTFQAGLYGLGGILNDPKYTGAIMSGQGMAGLFASLANIFSLAGGSRVEESAIGYFASAVAVTAVSFFAFFVLINLSYVRYHLTVQKHYTSSSSSSSYEQQTPHFWAIFKKIWGVALSVFLTFFVTLSIFPGVASNIKSVDAPSTDTLTTGEKDTWTVKYFTPIICFLLFNFGDFVGRTIAPWIPLISHRFLLIPVVLRLAFLPLFALCNVLPRSSDASVVFNSDIYPIVFMALMAISNGYLGTLSMMYGPNLVLTHEKETAGLMMSMFLTVGLASGAGFSFIITEGLNGFAGGRC